MTFFSRLASDFELMFKRPPRQQYAALCHRRNALGDLEILLVTSRDTGRWIIPKGWAMKDKPAWGVAEQEAYEEAGARGTIGHEPAGFYQYDKRLKEDFGVPCRVQVYPLAVTEMLADYPEREERENAWFSPEDAAKRVHESSLKSLILAFAEKA